MLFLLLLLLVRLVTLYALNDDGGSDGCVGCVGFDASSVEIQRFPKDRRAGLVIHLRSRFRSNWDESEIWILFSSFYYGSNLHDGNSDTAEKRWYGGRACVHLPSESISFKSPVLFSLTPVTSDTCREGMFFLLYWTKIH